MDMLFSDCVPCYFCCGGLRDWETTTFFVLILINRLLAITICIDIVTSLNKKKKARIKYRSETIACLVLWCSGDVESNPGPPCDDLRDFCKKMISLLVMKYFETTKEKQPSQGYYKKRPYGWPEGAFFGDPSKKCEKWERDTMLILLLDTCSHQGVDVPNEWLSLTEKYRNTLDKNCSQSEKNWIAKDLRAWVKNLRSKENVDQTFAKLLDVPEVDKNMIIKHIYEKLKRHVPDLHSDMLGSQTVEKNSDYLLVHHLDYDEQTADTSLNLSNPSWKDDVTKNYVDSNPEMIASFNDTAIKESNIYRMSSHSLGTTSATSTSTLSSHNTNSMDHDQWLDDIIVDSLSWNFTNETAFSPTDYLKNFDDNEHNFDNIGQSNNYIEQKFDYIKIHFDNTGHADETCRNKANLSKRKCTIDVVDDMRPSVAKQPAMLIEQNTGNADGASMLETETTVDGDTTLDDITQVIESDTNYLDLWD